MIDHPKVQISRAEVWRSDDPESVVRAGEMR